MGVGAGETPRRARSRWDETPVTTSGGVGLGATPAVGAMGATPVIPAGSATPGGVNLIRSAEADIDARNRPMTDEELDAILPSEGYKILEPPPSYVPIMTPARKLMATPAPMSVAADGFYVQEEGSGISAAQLTDIVPTTASGEELPHFKEHDLQFFGKLLDRKADEDLSIEEAKERKIMRLLLRIKNGFGPERKLALRQIAEKARDFGAGPLFNQILPLLMVGSNPFV
jgi:splicing factor 3B subunit 1